MKKLMSMVMIGLAMIAGVTGCDMNKDQIKSTCQIAGTAAVYGWLANDNPTDAQKAQVIETLAVVQSSLDGVGTNTYVEVIFPLVQNYVTASPKIPAKDKPLVMMGALAVLSGIDMVFKSNPEWKADVDNVNSYVSAFIKGANSVLVLPCTDDQCAPAQMQYKVRSAIKR
jgi:hypothetical protein